MSSDPTPTFCVECEIPGGLSGSGAGEFALQLFKKIAEEAGTGSVLFFQKASEKMEEKKGEHEPGEIYVGFDAFETISARGRRVTISHGKSDHFEVRGNPFAIVSQRITKYAPKNMKSASFLGGGAGFFGYDAVRFVEPVLESAAGAFSRLADDPEHLDACVVLFKKFFHFDLNGKKPVLKLIAIAENSDDAFADHRRFLMMAPRGPSPLSIDSSFLKSSSKKVSEKNVEDMKASLGRETFLKGVEKLKEYIAAGDIFQAVLAEKFEFHVEAAPLDYFEALMRTSRSAYQFYLTSEGRVYMGSSPEMLLRVRGADLETHPIAGTRPRGQTEEEERKFENQLRKSPKENAEHLMLVDLARNDLGRIAIPGSVKVISKMEIKKFPGVMHLVSKVTGKRDETKSAMDALMACFPAGTLSGAPKIRAMELLSEIEKMPRGFYGGAMALLSFSGDIDSCITIRSIEINGEKGFVQAGAGVVADSSPEREYDEVLHKTRTVRQALALAEKSRREG